MADLELKGHELKQLDGVLVLNKPSGPTSNKCLLKIKRLGQKKIGHAGTLDPLANGVLLVLLGQATKISSYLMQGGKKIYKGVLRLGLETDTFDIDGKIVNKLDYSNVSVDLIKKEISLWEEIVEQVVPEYSATKHLGQPLYKLARKGCDVPKKVKSVEILQAEMLDVTLPLVSFRVTCSSGTYVRSLAHSLGKRLGCGAVLTELTREYSHPFGLKEASDLNKILENPENLINEIRPLESALPTWPRLNLDNYQYHKVINGMALPVITLKDSMVKDTKYAILFYDNKPIALAEKKVMHKELFWTVLRGLWN